MAQLIGYLVAFIIVFGIPYLIDKKNEKIEKEKNAEEFMKKHFGEDWYTHVYLPSGNKEIEIGTLKLAHFSEFID